MKISTLATFALIPFASVGHAAPKDICEDAATSAVAQQMERQEIEGEASIYLADPKAGIYEIHWSIAESNGDCWVPYEVKTERFPIGNGRHKGCRVIKMIDLRDFGNDYCS